MPSRKSEGLSSSNAQEVYKSSKSRSAYQMNRSLESRINKANERLEKLKEAGFEKTQFYQNHRKGFEMPKEQLGRKGMSKRMAEVNRFLNSQSSTVGGMKRTRRDIINSLNKSSKIELKITEENLDDFLDFMTYYDEHVKNQTRIPSDFVANEVFNMHQNLQVSKEDLMKNMEAVYDYEEQVKNMKLEDMFLDGKVDKRVRFKVADYLDKVFW